MCHTGLWNRNCNIIMACIFVKYVICNLRRLKLLYSNNILIILMWFSKVVKLQWNWSKFLFLRQKSGKNRTLHITGGEFSSRFQVTPFHSHRWWALNPHLQTQYNKRDTEIEKYSVCRETERSQKNLLTLSAYPVANRKPPRLQFENFYWKRKYS